MSRTSPPVIDEDFDLCISETNLPFPYSDHCSTGPPSLYEFDEDEGGEEGDDGDEEYEEREEDREEDHDSEETRDESLQDNDSDEIPSLTLSRLRTDSYDRSTSIDTPNDISHQLRSRLEHIQENDRSGVAMASPSDSALKISRPRYSRRSYSYESNGEWNVEEQEENSNHSQPTQDEQQPPENSLISTVTSTVSSVAYAVGKHWSKKIYESLLRSRDPKAYYTHLLEAATNYEQWSEAAVVLDRLQGKDKWKNDPKSPHYDYEMLQERLSQLATARASGDLGQMIFLLRTSLSRNIGNVGQRKLYAETIIGTKRLIEDYNSEVIRQLNIICDTESDDFSMAAKLEFFTHTRQAFGRTALLLSGGATMGLMHIGVIKTLHENNLLPRIISGSSCGSIIAAILCTRTDDEIPSMLQFDRFNFNVFHTLEETGDYLARLIHFLRNGALFDAQVLKAALKENIGDITFQEAYNRTRRILNITVSTSATFEMPRLLNYLTAPNVLIWSAVATSCAAPFIYNSAPLIAKDRNGEEVQWNPSRYHWIDGSVENDLPMNKLSELFNVNHFIVCQVNPYIVPFLQNAIARSPANRVLDWVLFQMRSELQHRMNQLSILGVMPELIHKVQSIMSQQYYGDITIVPSISAEDYLNIVSNPNVDFLEHATLKGERATWPKISIIKNHCSIEHCLDDILYRLRLRRFQAISRMPATLSKTPNENPDCHQKQVIGVTATSSLGPASLGNPKTRNSISTIFEPAGRSNSSPASPTATAMANLMMSQSTKLGECLVPDQGTNGLLIQTTSPTDLRIPMPNTVDTEHSNGVASIIKRMPFVHQSQNGSTKSSGPRPSFKRANSSGAQLSSPLTTTSSINGSKTPAISRHRNSISSTFEYRPRLENGYTSNTMENSSSRRSSSSSVSSTHSSVSSSASSVTVVDSCSAKGAHILNSNGFDKKATTVNGSVSSSNVSNGNGTRSKRPKRIQMSSLE
ncbi:hypothetical protein BGZ80_009364 [Entomortierella chlamydospora]|uniref:PNPLA domain-containing protein n=1 Tax=Entomortierella chlamydospora TaxID=101097 RepID=A0A9P6MX62_9FUNG|nr:hypothetical protein BGZ79_002553 [Entomortierella chlamydospora]KAG0016214.1 hypothetical protein BGZ80_009364 [Entomortierella chlamydospora]